jgi:hypothetical protein
MKIKLMLAVAATVMAGSVMAQSAFEGFYAQVGIGLNDTTIKPGSADLTVNNGPFAGRYARNTTYQDDYAFTGSVSLGYYFAVNNDFLLGIGADYSPVASKTGNATTVGAAGVKTYSTYKTLNHFNVFLSPAYAVEKDKLIYGKVGYSQTETQIDFPSLESPNHTAGGYVLGLGYKQIIKGGFYGFAEGNYFVYNPSTYSVSSSNAGVSYTSSQNISSTGYNLLVGVGYKF